MEAAGTATTVQKRGRRGEAKPWEKLALKGGGGGGLLIAGGVLIAAFAVGRAWKRRPSSASSRTGEEIEGLYGKNREKESQIDREGNSSNNQKKNYVSKNPDLVEKKENGCVLPNESGEKEGRSHNPIKKQSSEESQCVLGDVMEKEIKVDLIQPHADLGQNSTVQVLEKSEFILVDEVGEEEIASDISLMDEFKEVEESLPSESELALDNEELKKSETIITESNDARIATSELVLSPTKEIEKKQEPNLEKTACIDDVSELVSTAAQEIRAELIASSATGEIKNEESGSGITACVDEIAGLVLAATKGINIQDCHIIKKNIQDCHSVHISAELVLDHPEEIKNEENSSNERTACAAANELLKEDDSDECIRKVDEGVRDEMVLAPAEEIKREEEILLQEPQVKIESEINEQKEEEEPKLQLSSSQEEEKETFSTKSEHGIEEKEDKTQSNTEDSRRKDSSFGTRKEIEKEGGKFSQTEHHPQHIVKRVQFSVVKEIHKIDKEEDEGKESESSAEMREESKSIKISWAVSNTETVCPIEVIEQTKFLPATELKEEQKESILVKTLHPSDDVQREWERKGANDAREEIEEEREEQKESIATKRLNTIKTDHGFIMDHDHNRLFAVLSGITLILGILCFFNSSHLTEFSSQLYQVIFPAVEEIQ